MMSDDEAVRVGVSEGRGYLRLPVQKMWNLFRSSGSSGDTEASRLNEMTPAESQRNKQINWLKEEVKGIVEITRDRWYRVTFPIQDKHITLDIQFSERIFDKPVITASPRFTHPWFNSQMIVTGSHSLQNFTPHSNIGIIVKEIINELMTQPPIFDPSASVPMATNLPYPVTDPLFSSHYITTPASATNFSPSSSNDALYETVNDALPLRNFSPQVRHSSIFHRFPIPNKLPGIAEKNIDELEKYLNDEDAVVLIDKYISQLDIIKQLKDEMEMLFSQSEDQARINLVYESSMQESWVKLQDRHLELQTLKEKFEELQKTQGRLMGRLSRGTALRKLKTLCQDADINSETIAEDFLNEKLESSSFIQKFLQERKLYHLRASKLEAIK